LAELHAQNIVAVTASYTTAAVTVVGTPPLIADTSNTPALSFSSGAQGRILISVADNRHCGLAGEVSFDLLSEQHLSPPTGHDRADP
jgi:hypothetical protein